MVLLLSNSLIWRCFPTMAGCLSSVWCFQICCQFGFLQNLLRFKLLQTPISSCLQHTAPSPSFNKIPIEQCDLHKLDKFNAIIFIFIVKSRMALTSIFPHSVLPVFQFTATNLHLWEEYNDTFSVSVLKTVTSRCQPEVLLPLRFGLGGGHTNGAAVL